MRIKLKPLHIYALMIALAIITAAQAPSAAKWTPTGSSKFSTSSDTFLHGSYTKLLNGSVIGVGGGGTDEQGRSVEIYDPKTGTWQDAAPLNFPRTGHSALLLPNGKLFVIGGLKPRPTPPAIPAGPPEIYDPATGTWMALSLSGENISGFYNLSPLPLHLLLPSGKVLIIARFGGVTTFYLDPNTGIVTSGPVFQPEGTVIPGFSGDTAAVLYNGKVLLLLSRRVLLLDPEAGKWTELNLPKTNGVELFGRIAALLPDGNIFAHFNTFPTQEQPKFTNYTGIFNAGALSFGNFVQQSIGDSGINEYSSVLLPQGDAVLSVEGLGATLYNTKTGQGKATDNPKGDVVSTTLLADGRVLSGERLYGRDFESNLAPTLVTASAASYRVEPLAPGSIATVFGPGIGGQPIYLKFILALDDPPAPYITRKLAPFSSSSDQSNFLIPSDFPEGQVEITIGNQRGLLSIASQAPGIFTADASEGKLPAAASVLVKTDRTQVYEPVARLDASTGRFLPVTIDLGPEGEQVYLVIFGTGWRRPTLTENTIVYIGGVKASVQYTGVQGTFAGLDQMNVLIPRNLVGKGKVDVLVTVDGKTANPVEISIK